jgi:hypothetical protein
MDYIHKQFEKILKKELIKQNVPPELMADVAAKATESVLDIVPSLATSILTELKKRAPEMLEEYRTLETGFRERNYKRWAKGFDLLEMLIVMTQEVGEEIHHSAASQTKVFDPTLEALATLQARAILVAREILCLLQGGFADAALGRWRTLHEINVIANFISNQDVAIAERYLLHCIVIECKSIELLHQHQHPNDLYPISSQELEEAKVQKDKILKEHGKMMKCDWGWAAPIINKPHLTFFDIEKITKLDYWRPHYKWACQDTHAAHRHPHQMLGASEAQETFHLVGASNSGLAEPASITSQSLYQVTSSFIKLYPTVDRLIAQETMGKLIPEIEEAFFQASQKKHL